MTFLKWTVRFLLLLVLIAVGAFLHYTLPSTAVVQVTGTDVKRMDDGSDRTPDGSIAIRTRDVRFINTVTRSGKVRVYRNEDTGWGWPPYFKFDSADFTAKATSVIKSEKQQWVAVTSYGWRIRLLSMFPNITGFKIVPKDHVHIPWFNIVFLIVLATLIFLVVRWFRRFIDRLRIDERFDAGTEPIANIVAWAKTERESWRKKSKKRPPPRRLRKPGSSSE